MLAASMYYSTALGINSSKQIHTVFKLGNWAEQQMGGKNNERVNFFGATSSLCKIGRPFALILSSETSTYYRLVR